MKSLSSYLLLIMNIMYWIFRIVVSVTSAMEIDFLCSPLDPNVEIFILFLSVPCFIFIIRRNLWGTLLYFFVYATYFGTILYNSLTGMPAEAETWAFADLPSIIATAVGTVLPTFTLLDVIIEKSGFKPKDKNTEWFYGNKEFDRKLDERADTNQYKIK